MPETVSITNPRIGIEVYPGPSALRTIIELSALNLARINVTHHAGKSLETTFDVLRLAGNELTKPGKTNIKCVPHLSCVGLPIDDVPKTVESLKEMGIDDAFVIFGDLNGQPMPAGHYQYPNELIEAILRVDRTFTIGVSGNPRRLDEKGMIDLNRKLKAGAQYIISNYAFDNEPLLRYRDAVTDAGIEEPLALGVMPIYNFAQAKRLAAMHGVEISAALEARFDGLSEKGQATEGAKLFNEQIEGLRAEGVEDLQIFTMDKIEPTLQTLSTHYPELLLRAGLR